MDYTVHGILWARILEWVAFPFFKGSFEPRSPTLQADSFFFFLGDNDIYLFPTYLSVIQLYMFSMYVFI